MKFGKMRPLALISVLTITACLLLSSCSGLLDSGQPAQRTFLLTPYSPSVAASTGGEINGLTVKLAAAPGLDSDRLLTLSPDAGLSHFPAHDGRTTCPSSPAHWSGARCSKPAGSARFPTAGIQAAGNVR